MMIDSVKCATICNTLKMPNALDILSELIHKQQCFSYFTDRYGKQITYQLYKLAECGMIAKIYDQYKIPYAYKLTRKGRMIAHACIRFEKQLESVTNE